MTGEIAQGILNKNLILGGLHREEAEAVAKDHDAGQRCRHQPPPIRSAYPRLEPELLRAAQHFTRSNVVTETATKLFNVSGNAVETQQHHQRREPRSCRSRSVSFHGQSTTPLHSKMRSAVSR